MMEPCCPSERDQPGSGECQLGEKFHWDDLPYRRSVRGVVFAVPAVWVLVTVGVVVVKGLERVEPFVFAHVQLGFVAGEVGSAIRRVRPT